MIRPHIQRYLNHLRYVPVYLAPKKYIFIISHMRSYSSLLSHILGSHPQIGGYTENHLSYISQKDLWKLKREVFKAGNPLNRKFILDKILHNYCEISDEMLKHPNIFFLVMVRNPEQTIKSMLNLFQSQEYPQFHHPEGCATYYEERLEGISNLLKKGPKNCFFFKAERVTEDSQALLSEIQDVLQLKSPLKTKYELFPFTGQIGKGDSSEFIEKGEIVRKTTNRFLDIDLSKEILEHAEKKYKRLLNEHLQVRFSYS